MSDAPELGDRCNSCNHVVRALERWPPPCPCSCHTWDAPHQSTEDRVVRRLRSTTDALDRLAAEAVPDRPQAYETLQRAAYAAWLADRAINVLCGHTPLPGDTLEAQYPAFELDLTPIDPGDLPPFGFDML